MNITKILKASLIGLFGLGLAANAQATVITYELDFEFSGAYSPESTTTTWLVAEFDDSVGTDKVQLTMTTPNLTEQEFVGGWYFNYDTDITDLAPTHGSGPTAGSILIRDASTAAKDADFKADGDGYFDIVFSFDNGVFGAGDTSIYTFEGTGLTASSFDLLSAPGGGNGSYSTAAHVQGIDITGDDNDGSGWIGPSTNVPQPASIALLGLGLLLMGLMPVVRK